MCEVKCVDKRLDLYMWEEVVIIKWNENIMFMSRERCNATSNEDKDFCCKIHVRGVSGGDVMLG
jgi:hypothetical protein